MNMYDRLIASVEGLEGWTPIEQLQSLVNLTLSVASLDGELLELGSWCGRSSISLGLASMASNKPVVNCVDLFPNRDDWYKNTDGTYSFEVNINGKAIRSYDEQTVWEEPFKNSILPVYSNENILQNIFQKNIDKAGVSSVIKPFRGELAQYLEARSEVKYKLIFLDGDHSYDHVSQEIELLTPRIVSGGWLCFDDAFTSYEGVNRAIEDHVINSDEFNDGFQLTRKLFAAQKK